MKSKTWIVVLLLILIGSNVYWLTKILDAGISYTYLESSLDLAQRNSKAAVRLSNLNIVGFSREDALAVLRAQEPELSVIEKPQENCIYVAELCVSINSADIVQEVKE